MTRGGFMKFRLGDFVEVANPELKTYGITGKISDDGTNYWFSYKSDSAYVDLDDGRKIYYNLKNLKKVDENKKKENIDMAITGDFQVAKIKFMGGTNTNTEFEYAMFENYQIGDVVVVASAHHGLGVAKIIGITTKDKATTKKFEREIVCKIDMESYHNRKINRARLQELNNRMEKRAQELNKLAVFEMLAEKDESLKDMLEEYKALIG